MPCMVISNLVISLVPYLKPRLQSCPFTLERDCFTHCHFTKRNLNEMGSTFPFCIGSLLRYSFSKNIHNFENLEKLGQKLSGNTREHKVGCVARCNLVLKQPKYQNVYCWKCIKEFQELVLFWDTTGNSLSNQHTYFVTN